MSTECVVLRSGSQTYMISKPCVQLQASKMLELEAHKESFYRRRSSGNLFRGESQYKTHRASLDARPELRLPPFAAKQDCVQLDGWRT